VQETDGDMLWNGSEETANVRSKCQEDEGTECEDGESDFVYKVNEINSKIFF
jgi:hypothetical protein